MTGLATVEPNGQMKQNYQRIHFNSGVSLGTNNCGNFPFTVARHARQTTWRMISDIVWVVLGCIV